MAATDARTATQEQWEDLANKIKTSTDFIYMTSGNTNSITLPSGYTSYHLEVSLISPSQANNGSIWLNNISGGQSGSNWTRRLEISTGNTIAAVEYEQSANLGRWDVPGDSTAIGTGDISMDYIADIMRGDSTSVTNNTFNLSATAYIGGSYSTAWTSSRIVMSTSDAAVTLQFERNGGSISKISWRLRAYK